MIVKIIDIEHTHVMDYVSDIPLFNNLYQLTLIRFWYTLWRCLVDGFESQSNVYSMLGDFTQPLSAMGMGIDAD
ncbi:hypothetical protein H5202_03760 [Shewanella sp. SG41-4]|uniref:hypothetical protein n=1 Tax=Shewanella sp. SG41-4 TaxID=2760976 RepID=UPI0016048E3B|nr:hypothetical protein [Shewanella sp. SG41-4]MBB1437806.1 hypothetical protein [Shewanella sp. SG41-4]